MTVDFFKSRSFLLVDNSTDSCREFRVFIEGLGETLAIRDPFIKLGADFFRLGALRALGPSSNAGVISKTSMSGAGALPLSSV